jgi:type II secretory pathway component PulF
MTSFKNTMNKVFFEFFGNMIGGGVPLVVALKAFEKDCPDKEYTKTVAKMREEICSGENFMDCLDEFELCESVKVIIEAGVKNGELDYACLKVCKVLEANEKMVEACKNKEN